MRISDWSSDVCSSDLRLKYFEKEGKLLEAERLERRTKADIAMIREIGYCNGIENYSRHLSGRAEGKPPETLLDYFPENFLTVIDESHVKIGRASCRERVCQYV